MKDDEFTICPMCEVHLEQHTILDHHRKGIIQDVVHHVCSNCGEIFLSEEAFDIIHSHGRKEKIPA